jgi:hypothetical protein
MPSVEGVDDNSPPRGFGVLGRSNTHVGVVGRGNNATGVIGSGFNGDGVVGYSNTRIGVRGESNNAEGVYGYSYNARGVNGESYDGFGVRGYSVNRPGVFGDSIYDHGVYGNSDFGYGVYGRGYENYGVYASSHASYGLYASSDAGLAARLEGRVDMTSDVNMAGPVSITGSLTKPAGSFRIDHPLDPANKYLYHSVVESPDMKNVYNGMVTLDEKGEAEIELPDWFGALNKDFRYQLTPVGAPGPNLYISEEISSDGVTTNSSNSSNSNKNNSSRCRFLGSGNNPLFISLFL